MPRQPIKAAAWIGDAVGVACLWAIAYAACVMLGVM
jgi:hypothetical protein